MVDEAGINLAGVQRLLDVAEIVERMRPLVSNDTAGRQPARRRLARELEHLIEVLGL
jgi:hypothetical protein